MHSCVHHNIITIDKIWKQPKCPTLGEWNKEDVVCIYEYKQPHAMGYYAAMKEGNPSVFYSMDGI